MLSDCIKHIKVVDFGCLKVEYIRMEVRSILI